MASLLSRLFKRPTPAVEPNTNTATATSVEGFAQLLNETRDANPLAVLGETGSGKSVFVDRMVPLLEGCVIHVTAARTPLKGFESAPLTGDWTAAVKGTSAASTAEDLEDTLQRRSEGRLHLEMPYPHLVEPALHGVLKDAFRRWFSSGGSRPDATAPRLTFVIDDSVAWFDETVLDHLCSRGRAYGARVIIAEQSMTSTLRWNSLGHLVSFRQRTMSDRLASLLEIPARELCELPAGEARFRLAMSGPQGGETKVLKVPLNFCRAIAPVL